MPDDRAAADALTSARETRTAAQVLDPAHTDPAWAEDAALMRVPSDQLLAFYADYFAPDVPR